MKSPLFFLCALLSLVSATLVSGKEVPLFRDGIDLSATGMEGMADRQTEAEQALAMKQVLANLGRHR